MPRLTVTEAKINSLVTCLKPTIPLLNEVHDSFGTPFVQAIANTTVSLITTIQNVKRNKEDCIQLMEKIHQVLYGIINLHIRSEPAGSLPPFILEHLGRFTETIHKIHAFVEAQQDRNRIRNLFRHSEMNTLLKNSQAGVRQALEVFKFESGATTLVNIEEMQSTADKLHRQLLELISTLPDEGTSDAASSMYRTMNSSQMSSMSFSMLPAKPKIFYGRDSELNNIIQMLHQEAPRIAILGPGGMGKTNLARAALHHPDIIAKYEHRLFVSCDSAITSIDIAALIGAHIGLKPGKDVTKLVIQALSKRPSCLLILDNLETTWEPLESRPKVEELLSLLTDLKHLALMITMRGAERPAKVGWTRPFLSPLKPLSAEAAKRLFMDIADVHDTQEIDELLYLTDNMPLAVDLIAHLVDYDGVSSVLSRWETEKTTLISRGYDKRSNLDISIRVSLSSPRLASLPGTLDLLTLLSILPNGLSDIELLQSELPIQDILACKAALLGTSLAFIDNKKRLNTLVPIREHIQHFQKISPALVKPLQMHFHKLLNLYQVYRGSLQATPRISQITSNFANLHQVLLQGLQMHDSDLADTIECILALNNFSRLAGYGPLALMEKIPGAMPQPPDHRLEVEFITEVLGSHLYQSVENPELLVSEAISHAQHFNDPELESRFYRTSGYFYAFHANQVTKGIEFLQRGLSLAKSIFDVKEQSLILTYLANIDFRIGKYSTGKIFSTEAQKLAKLTANLYDEARALCIEAMCLRDLGDYKDTFVLLQRGRELLQLCGMSEGYLNSQLWNSEAEIHLLKSEYGESRKIYFQVGQDTSVDLDIWNYATSLVNVAKIDVIIGRDRHEVQENLEKAIVLYNDVKFAGGVNDCEMILADLHLREGAHMIAKKMFERCFKVAWTIFVPGSSYCLERMADINRWHAVDLHWSSTCTVVYFAFAKKYKDKLAQSKALRCLGDVFLADGEVATAEVLFLVALECFTYMDVHQGRADCMLRLGKIAKKAGASTKAALLWKEAKPLFGKSLQANAIAEIETRLADLESLETM